MFNTSDDVAAGALSYKAFTWDLNQTNCSGSVVKYDQPAAAGEAAAKAVLAKCPQLALTCANVTGEALALQPHPAAAPTSTAASTSTRAAAPPSTARR